MKRHNLTAYSKRKERDAYIIRIAVEGDQTEVRFFQKCFDKSSRVRIEVIPPENHQSGPEKLFAHLEKIIREEAESGNLTKADQNWIVVDVDEHAYLQETIEKVAKSKYNIQIAISNPCFEVWMALYKHRNLRSKGMTCKLKNPADILKLVKEIDPHYSKTSFNFSCFSRHETAIPQAVLLDKNKSSPMPPCPSTRVYVLVEKILQLMGKR